MSKLTKLAEEAYLGNRDSCTIFLVDFKGTELVVVDRHQSVQLKGVVAAPSPFFPFLAVESEGDKFVPCFDNEESLRHWCSIPLTYRLIKGEQLLNLIPESWSIIFNPTSSIEKIFSPWEINLLKGGTTVEIAEILSEIYNESIDDFLDIKQVEGAHYQRLMNELDKLFSSKPEVVSVWLLEAGWESVNSYNKLASEAGIGSGNCGKELLIAFSVDLRKEKIKTNLDTTISPISSEFFKLFRVNHSAPIRKFFELFQGRKSYSKLNRELKRDELFTLQDEIKNQIAPLTIGIGTIQVLALPTDDKGPLSALLSTFTPFFRRR